MSAPQVRLDRRGALKLGVGALVAPLVIGATRSALAGSDFAELRHLLSRTGFGNPLPNEISALRGLSYGDAVMRVLGEAQSQVPPLAVPPAWVGETLGRQRQLVEAQRSERDAAASGDKAVAAAPARGIDGRELAAANLLRERLRQLRNWWIEEMLITERPLRERMTLFWHGHFTSGFQKVKYVAALHRQNQLFRQHALGNFATLLRAVARDPAMLIYLDGAQNRAGQPNENFARELLELFTLGEGHYREPDIRAAARAFTGWSIDRDSGAFRFYPALHDGGEKEFLGQRGRFGGEEIIDILLRHPRTAELLVARLWREFVAFEIAPAEQARLAALLRSSGYEIRPLLQAMFTSPAFRDPQNRGGLIKSPVDLVVGTVRLLGLPVPEKTRLARALQVLGQILFDPPNVKGWPGGPAWITTGSLLLRQQVLRRLIEATTVAPMQAGAMPGGGRRAERTEQLMSEPAQGMEPRPVEGRSLRNAGQAARLGPTLAAVPARDLPDLLLPLPPRAPPAASDSGGAVVAELLLDPAYQLK